MPAPLGDPYSITLLKIPKIARNTLSLAKCYTCPAPGALLEQVDYSAGIYFEYVRKSIPTIHAWAELQKTIAPLPYICAIRGEPIASLNPEKAQRLLVNFPDTPRCHLLIDFDAPTLPRGEDGAIAARLLLPEAFHTAPFWWQRTGSYGVNYAGRETKDDPWRSRIRLAFMLDKPLDAPRIKRWLRHHGCDLAIYTANQITYTANPVFRDCAIDPVLAAGEERFGTVDMDDAVDVVIVPDEIFNYTPPDRGTTIVTRNEHISETLKATLLQEAQECDALEGFRHGAVIRWVYDAYGCGLDEEEIVNLAAETLERLGRSKKASRPEAERMLAGARSALTNGTLWISDHLTPGKGFEPITDPNDPILAGIILTPAQATAQAQALLPWWLTLKGAANGGFKSSLDNAAIILANHSSFKDKTKGNASILAYDQFQRKPVWTSPPPWWRSRPEKSNPIIGDLGYPVDEDDDAVACAIWLGHLDPASGNEGTPIHLAPKTVAQAIAHVAKYTTVNPAQLFLDKCADNWDGVPRLHYVLKDICHSTTDPKLLSIWFPKWLMQSVARIYNPGEKCDCILVFTGEQGGKKSTFFANLCPYPEWHMDALPEIRDKDAMQILNGKMIIELSEMLSAKKDVDYVKGFLTKRSDTYRASYGHTDKLRKRTVIFCGSSNDDECLFDIGGRRWWMVSIPEDVGVTGTRRIDLDRQLRERDQWWGEAVHRYRNGEHWWLEGDDERASSQIAMDHSSGMEQTLDILRWIDSPHDHGGPEHPDIVLPTAIWTGALGRSMANWNTGSGRIVAGMMKSVKGWKREEFAVRNGKHITKFKAYIRRESRMSIDIQLRNDYMLKHTTTSPVGAEFSTSTNPAA